MAVYDIRNTFVRRSICIILYMPLLVFSIVLGALAGAIQWSVELHDVIRQTWG